jgi:hypothetical protein
MCVNQPECRLAWSVSQALPYRDTADGFIVGTEWSSPREKSSFIDPAQVRLG